MPPLLPQKKISVETATIALVFIVQGKKLCQAYLGPKLPSIPAERSVSVPAYSAAGMDDLFEVALRVVHADGNTSTDLAYVNDSRRPVDENIAITKISLRDAYYDFFVDLFFKAYTRENIIEQWVEIRHAEKKAVTLYDYASSQLSLRACDYWLTQFHGDWGDEMNMTEAPLTRGIKIVDSKLGVRATRFAAPCFMLSLDSPATEDCGAVLGATLAWPGSFSLRFEMTHARDLRVLCGINSFAAHYNLEAGAAFVTPSLLFSFSNKGKGAISRNFHCWARDYGIGQGHAVGPALLNNWEATGFDFNEQKLGGLMAAAADVGLELFLLDDGWFANKYPRDSDTVGLGDWEVNAKKLPRGISYLVKESEKNGIKFGIWIEPEMVSPQSELYEKHPDWAIAQPNRAIDLSRHQLILDLTNPAVQEFVFTTVDHLLTNNPGIAFVKWDCNRHGTNGGSPYLAPQNQSHLWIEYSRALLNIFSKVSTAHPAVEMMLCSGGGGRLEYGSLKYFHEFWPSDNTDAVQRILIQWGCSCFFPAMAICSFVSASPNVYFGRSTPLKFRFDVAMSGLTYRAVDHDPSRRRGWPVRLLLVQRHRGRLRPLHQRLSGQGEGQEAVISSELLVLRSCSSSVSHLRNQHLRT
ncbi:MAG: alpha-galactosidase, partial [Chitinivibrionales bacterium]|nr:alpha-galactosidase [Chitinivibrionales bacterium]